MKLIDDCLRSVQEQVGSIPLEILVHDDASCDGSAAYIRDHYPEVELIVSEHNVGFCIANNRMAAAAKGKYILLLNNDAALHRDALQTLLADVERQDRPAILSLPQYDAATGELIDMGSLLDPFLNPVPNRDSGRSEVGMVMGSCLWIPKTLWEELDGFPIWFDSIAEDLYLCCRARLAGHSVRTLSCSGYRHWQGMSFSGKRVTSDYLSSTLRRRALSERNKSFVMVLTYPTPLLQTVLPIHFALLLVEGAVLTLLKRDGNLMLGIYWACLRGVWRERHRLLKLRRTIQSTRSVSLASWLSVFRAWPHKLTLLLKHGLPIVH
jgi:GT2 family glycosyltransferase